MTTPTVPLFDATAYATEFAADAVDRASIAEEQFARMLAADVGHTESEVVYAENKLRLRKYTPAAVTQETPIVLVYALINRPFILDLQPDSSVVKSLLDAGFELYLVDWGEPSRLDQSLGLEDYVCRYLDNCVDHVRAAAGVDDVHLLGYCMGGTLSVIYSALYPEKVRTLGAMALAFNFDGDSGVYESWAEPVDIELVADAVGNFPADEMAAVFSMRDPVVTMVTRFVDLYDRLDQDFFVEMYSRMEQWSWDGVDIGRRVFSQFVRDIYQENRLARNELRVGGRHVDLDNITMPVVQVIGEEDGIAPPNCARPFGDAVPAAEYREFSMETGHFGVSISPTAHEELWPQVAQWYAERSPRDVELGGGLEDTHDGSPADREAAGNGHAPALEAVDGIGPTYADRLAAAGLTSPGDLAGYSPEELADIAETTPARTEGWLDQVA